MSEATTEASAEQTHGEQTHGEQASAEQTHGEQASVDHHPSDRDYVKIAAILGLITAIEVSTYFQSVFDWGAFLIPALLVMMVVKFWLVTRMFMHLKNDEPVLSQLFAGGLSLAVGVYIIALFAFNFWG